MRKITNIKLQKGELNEHGAKSRANTIVHVKAAWGVSELIDIFPKEIRPSDQLGSTTITNLRTISKLCPDLKKAQEGFLRVCTNPDGSYKPFSFSQSKTFMEQLKEKNTPSAKMAKAQAAGQELLASIGKASLQSSAAADDEETSIVVDTAPRQKPNKKSRASLGQEKHGQIPTPTMAPTAPVAVMSTEGSQSPTKTATAPVAVFSKDGSQAPTKVTTAPVAVMSKDGPQALTKVATAPVAVMSTKGSQAPGPKAKTLKKSRIDLSGRGSDSDDSGSEDTGINTGILDLVNGNTASSKAADNGFGKGSEKPAKSRFATAETVSNSLFNLSFFSPFVRKMY